VSHYIASVKNPPSCDAAFRQTSLTTCSSITADHLTSAVCVANRVYRVRPLHLRGSTTAVVIRSLAVTIADGPSSVAGNPPADNDRRFCRRSVYRPFLCGRPTSCEHLRSRFTPGPAVFVHVMRMLPSLDLRADSRLSPGYLMRLLSFMENVGSEHFPVNYIVFILVFSFVVLLHCFTGNCKWRLYPLLVSGPVSCISGQIN